MVKVKDTGNGAGKHPPGSDEALEQRLRDVLHRGSRWGGSPDRLWRKVAAGIDRPPRRWRGRTWAAASIAAALALAFGLSFSLPALLRTAPDKEGDAGFQLPDRTYDPGAAQPSPGDQKAGGERQGDQSKQNLIGGETEHPAEAYYGSSSRAGSLAGAEAALGFRAWKPAFLPAGAFPGTLIYWDGLESAVSPGYITQVFYIGGCDASASSTLYITQERAAPNRFAEIAEWCRQNGAVTVPVNGGTGFLYTPQPAPAGRAGSGHSLICWQEAGYLFYVSGALDPEELLKTARSLRPPGN